MRNDSFYDMIRDRVNKVPPRLFRGGIILLISIFLILLLIIKNISYSNTYTYTFPLRSSSKKDTLELIDVPKEYIGQLKIGDSLTVQLRDRSYQSIAKAHVLITKIHDLDLYVIFNSSAFNKTILSKQLANGSISFIQVMILGEKQSIIQRLISSGL